MAVRIDHNGRIQLFQFVQKFLVRIWQRAVATGDRAGVDFKNAAAFCRLPDIIGHFDLITKFEEVAPANYFGNRVYRNPCYNNSRSAK